MTKPVVHILDPVHEDALRVLDGDFTLRTGHTPEGWHADADAVIVRNTRVTADDIARAPRLKVIGKHGAGTDNIDVEAARAAGVEVHSTPGLNADSVAELALAMALCLLRDLSRHSDAVKAGAPLTGAARVGLEVCETPVGIVGLGAIGGAVARRLAGFGARIRAFDIDASPREWPVNVERASSLEALLRGSRLVFLHLPLTDRSRGSIGAEALALMPKGSFLVNCARGGIVDEKALAEALADGHLAGAASDVFAVEPPEKDNPLLAQPNFIATPHLGASTNAGLSRVGSGIASVVAERLRALA